MKKKCVNCKYCKNADKNMGICELNKLTVLTDMEACESWEKK
jgi:hypothetical protein